MQRQCASDLEHRKVILNFMNRLWPIKNVMYISQHTRIKCLMMSISFHAAMYKWILSRRTRITIDLYTNMYKVMNTCTYINHIMYSGTDITITLNWYFIILYIHHGNHLRCMKSSTWYIILYINTICILILILLIWM